MKSRLPRLIKNKISGTAVFRDQTTVTVSPERLVEVLTALKDNEETSFPVLLDLTAADRRLEGMGFEVIYHLLNPDRGGFLRVKTALSAESPRCPSVTGIWPGANWLEREVFDMFGIDFPGHPDLRRILMPDEWNGHPLCKDYPLELEEES